MTPEGRTKKVVKALLKEHGVYYFMPVQSGYGSPGLDFHCIHKGRGFCVETKFNKPTTPRQHMTGLEVNAAGGKVFVVGENVTGTREDKDLTYSGMAALEIWLLGLTS